MTRRAGSASRGELFLLLGGLGGLAAGLAWTGPTLGTLGSATLLYSGCLAVVLALVHRHGAVLDRGWVLLGVALVLRLLFLPSITDLSVDPFRYVWDGWLHGTGVNPYRFTPSDPILADRHGEILFRQMNSRDFFSIYPPLSQWLFLPAGLAYEHLGWPAVLYVLKGTLAVVEAAGVILLFLALRALDVNARWLALYAWNPLVLVTVPAVGHSEAGLVAGLGLLALGLARRRPVLAWTGLGLAIVSKVVPLLVAPLLLKHHAKARGWRFTFVAAGVGLLPALVLSLPFLFPGLPHRLADSASLYVGLFEFNAGLFALLRAGLEPISRGHAGTHAGWILQGCLLAGVLAVWLRHPISSGRQVLAGALLLMGLVLATATTVHPWYLLWGLPLVPLVRRHRAAWLWASWAGFLTYFAYRGVAEALPAGLFWGGVFVLVLWDEWPRMREPLLRWAGRRKARQLCEYVGDGLVLDLGAGEGYVGEALGAPNRTLILADVARSFRVDLPAFVFDGRRLPLADGVVDTVVLSLVLHHARDPEQLLREAMRVAHHRVVVTESTFRTEWERRVLRWADRAVNWNRGPAFARLEEGPLSFARPEEWEQRIRAAGGRVIHSRRLNRVGHRHHLVVATPRQ